MITDEQPTTLEEAVERQREIHARIDAGEYIQERVWRSHSLKAGFEYRRVPEYGMGNFSVNIVTGEVCEWDGVWNDEGDVLLCRHCFEDGT